MNVHLIYFVYFNIFKILLGMNVLNDPGLGLCTSPPVTHLVTFEKSFRFFGFSLPIWRTKVLK